MCLICGCLSVSRNIAFIVLLVGIALILGVFILGMLCGVYGYSPTNIPFERSDVSNCGARILFVWVAWISYPQLPSHKRAHTHIHTHYRGVGICFVVCGMLLLFTSIVFALSGLIQKLCNDLAPSQYVALERLVDDPEVWGGYTLVGTLLRSSSLNANISMTETLRWALPCEYRQYIICCIEGVKTTSHCTRQSKLSHSLI